MNCDFYLKLKHKKAFVYFNITVKVNETIMIRTAGVKIFAQEAVDEVISCIACDRQNGGEQITARDLVSTPS